MPVKKTSIRIKIQCIALLLLLLPTVSTLAQVVDSSGKLPVLDTATGIIVTNAGPPAKDTLPLPQEGPKPHLYRMNYWFTGGFVAVATAANVYAIPNLIKAKKTITDEELAGLNPDALSGFDRWALRQEYSKIDRYDKNSDYVLQGIIAATATLALDKNIRRDALRLLFLYCETHAVTFSMYNFSFFGPSFQNKYRPVVYYTDLPTDVRNSGNNRNSLYSGHTASATASTFFMAKIYNDYHPEFSTGKKYMIYGLAAVPALLEGYYRMKALKHFPSDIMVGFIVGAVCGVAVPEMHRFKKQAIRWGVTGTPVGPGLCLTWTPGARFNESPARL